jgi:microsomal dipeptidase-like Zn-dependent dipeptidase
MSQIYPVVDLHCDLLCFLAAEKDRSPFDPLSCCSIPQLKEGNVEHQILAIFTETKKDSTQEGEKQLNAFKLLPKDSGIHFKLAIENASSFFEEHEKLENGFKRLQKALNEGHQFLYLSLTWNSENRFGGGNASQVGLKRDGEVLLEFLNEKKIAIDLSHTSDALALDILHYLDKKKMSIIPIASHSNFRSIAHHPRNLPDEIAKEIFRRKGIVGLNFVRGFIGKEPHDFYRHIQHAIELGGQEHLCFGADFFPEQDIPPEFNYLKPFFFSGFENSSCYPRLCALLASKYSEQDLNLFSHQNFFSYLKRRNLS